MVSSGGALRLSQSDVGNHQLSKETCQAIKKKKLLIYSLTLALAPWIMRVGVRLTMSEQAIPKKLIPLNAAAKRLGVKPGTLYRWKCAGQHISFYKVIGGVKCDPEEIDRLIARSRILPTVTA
jgi:hypothetical protein